MATVLILAWFVCTRLVGFVRGGVIHTLRFWPYSMLKRLVDLADESLHDVRMRDLADWRAGAFEELLTSPSRAPGIVGGVVLFARYPFTS